MMSYYNSTEHFYTLATVGLRKNKTKTFISRLAAQQYMYKICAKNNLVIKEIWNDNHDKTYNCDNGVAFFIQRSR